ncbi:unnamed protein product, partial [Prorocentrum cordatum]
EVQRDDKGTIPPLLSALAAAQPTIRAKGSRLNANATAFLQARPPVRFAMAAWVASAAPEGWQLGRWSKMSEGSWMEKKIGQPASPPAMFEVLTGGPVCPGSTTVRLRRVDCPEDDQIEVLILDTSLQVFRGGQYVGEYLGGYEGSVAPVAMAPIWEIPQSSFNSSAPAAVTTKMQTLQATPAQTLKVAPSTGARQKTGFDRSPAKVLALHNACSGGDAAAVKTLLDQGVDPDAPGEKGKTALIIAATKGSLPVVEALLAAGADPNIGSEEGGGMARPRSLRPSSGGTRR